MASRIRDREYATDSQLEASFRIALHRSTAPTVADALRRLYLAVRLVHASEIEAGARAADLVAE